MEVTVCFRSDNEEKCSELFSGENLKQGNGPECNYLMYCFRNFIENAELVEFMDREESIVKNFVADNEGDEGRSVPKCSLQKKYVASYTDGLGITFLFPAQYPIIGDNERRQRFFKLILDCESNKIAVDRMMDRVRRTDVFCVLWSTCVSVTDTLCKAVMYADLHLFVYSVVKDFLYVEISEDNLRALWEVIVEELRAQECSFFPDFGSQSSDDNTDEDHEEAAGAEVALCHDVLQRTRAKISTDADRAMIFDLYKKREKGLKQGIRLGNKLLHTVASILLPNEFLINELANEIRKTLDDFRYARKDECKFIFDVSNKKEEFVGVAEFASRFKNVRKVNATMYVVRYNGEEKSLTCFFAKWKKILKKTKLSIVDISNMLGRISCITEILSVQYTTRESVIGRFVPRMQELLEHYPNLENSVVINYHRSRHDVFEELFYEFESEIAASTIQKFSICSSLSSLLKLLHEPGMSTSVKKEIRKSIK